MKWKAGEWGEIIWNKREKKSKQEWESERERRAETTLPARGLSGLQALEQWQETSAWNFSLWAGMRAPYPGSRGPTPPCGQQRRHSLSGRAARASHRQPERVGGGDLMYIHILNDKIFVALPVEQFWAQHTLSLSQQWREVVASTLLIFSVSTRYYCNISQNWKLSSLNANVILKCLVAIQKF